MLVNAPIVDQTANWSNDGKPPEDANAQCVAASISSGAAALNPALRPDSPDYYKDAVYGDGYTGGTDPPSYFPFLATLGIHAWNVEGTPDQLIATIEAELLKGHPVLGAIPSLWGIKTAADIARDGGSTHEVCFCDYNAQQQLLTAMNPWRGFYHVQTVAWWRDHLVYNRVDPMERTQRAVWTQKNGIWTDSQGHTCGNAVAAFLTDHNLLGVDALLSEQFYDGAHAMLPLVNGQVLGITRTSDAHGNTSYTVTDGAGAGILVAIWSAYLAALTAAQHPAPTPASVADHALLLKLKAELAAVQP